MRTKILFDCYCRCMDIRGDKPTTEALLQIDFWQVMGGTRPAVSENWPAPFVKLLQAGWHPDMHKRLSFEEITTTLRR